MIWDATITWQRSSQSRRMITSSVDTPKVCTLEGPLEDCVQLPGNGVILSTRERSRHLDCTGVWTWLRLCLLTEDRGPCNLDPRWSTLSLEPSNNSCQGVTSVDTPKVCPPEAACGGQLSNAELYLELREDWKPVMKVSKILHAKCLPTHSAC